MRSRSAAARLFMVSAVLAGGAVARAQPTAAPLRIEYRAEAGCPTEADFRARVSARLRRALGEADAASAYVVTLEKLDGRFAGRLGVRGADGTASDRDVAGDTCDDVVAALAVVTALAIDAQRADAPAAVAAPVAAASASTAAAPPRPAGSGLARPPAPPPPAGSGRTRPPAPAPAPDVATHLTLGAQFLLGERIGAPSFGARIFAEPPVGAMDRGVGPLRFGAGLEAASDIPAAGGSASFLLVALAADACPLGATVGALHLAPCARVEGGLLAASRRGVAPVRSATRGWLALALPVRARLPLWGPFVLDVEAGVRMPLLRDGILAQGADAVARPPLDVVSALGLGLTIP
ncbi:hypothetical protein WMF28_33045 [Sorangium sp. So ce590]|uniref:hypothetical protein n=1 Tax=Sorangium sp. So ce590 TaxID=3133317 RepID=UPI003F5F6644